MTSKTYNIAMDLDSTLLDLTTMICRKINSDAGRQVIEPSQVHNWHWGELDRAFWNAYDSLLASGDYWNAGLDDAQAPWHVNALATWNNVDIVTSKPPEQIPNIWAWLKRNGFEGIRDVVVVKRVPDKADLAGYQWYFDDCPELIELIAKRPDKRLCLISKPYNRHFRELPGTWRVRHMSEGRKLVEFAAGYPFVRDAP